MIYNNVILTVRRDADVPRVRELLIRQGQASRTEPGCERFEVYHSSSEPRVFLLIERWSSAAHLDAHRNARAFREIYEPHVIPLVERVPHPCELIDG